MERKLLSYKCKRVKSIETSGWMIASSGARATRARIWITPFTWERHVHEDRERSRGRLLTCLILYKKHNG